MTCSHYVDDNEKVVAKHEQHPDVCANVERIQRLAAFISQSLYLRRGAQSIPMFGEPLNMICHPRLLDGSKLIEKRLSTLELADVDLATN